MLPLLAAAFLFAAAPAPAKKAETKPEPRPAAAAVADDGHGHEGHDHGDPPGHEGHGHGKKDATPLDETGQKMVAVSEALAGLTRANLAAYQDMLAAARDPKDCPAAARAVAARSKKLEADLAAKRAQADALRKGLEPRLQQEAAGIAIISLKDELAVVRKDSEDNSKVVLAYRGKCPKQADEVDKAIAAVRKRVAP